MTLLLTPLGNNSAQLSCGNCPACLVVTVKSPVRLRVLAERVAQDHRCDAA